MDNTPTAKQQIVERLKSAQSIVVTVGQNPHVADVAAALGLTRLLERFGKKVVAIISSPMPRELSFLKPERYVDDKIDRLRDFVIALDKEKADKLRYKAEDDVVKIFITPYKSAISQTDLRFSQGDYNVDTVVVIGAASRDNLDKVLTEHSNILRDATTLSLSVGADKATIGTPNWHEAEASSVAELLVSVADSLQSGLLDAETAQALLTSVVAATDGFRNKATTPKVMTIAAQLMASGADQQVVMNQLQGAKPASPSPKPPEAPKPQERVKAPVAEPRPVTPAPQPVVNRRVEEPVRPSQTTPAVTPAQSTSPAAGSQADSALAADAIDAVIANANQISADIDKSPTTVSPSVNQVALSHTQAPASSTPHVNVHPQTPTLQPLHTNSVPAAAAAASQAAAAQAPTTAEELEAARQAVEQAMSVQPQTGLPTPDPSLGSRTLTSDADIAIAHSDNQAAF